MRVVVVVVVVVADGVVLVVGVTVLVAVVLVTLGFVLVLVLVERVVVVDATPPVLAVVRLVALAEDDGVDVAAGGLLEPQAAITVASTTANPSAVEVGRIFIGGYDGSRSQSRLAPVIVRRDGSESDAP